MKCVSKKARPAIIPVLVFDAYAQKPEERAYRSSSCVDFLRGRVEAPLAGGRATVWPGLPATFTFHRGERAVCPSAALSSAFLPAAHLPADPVSRVPEDTETAAGPAALVSKNGALPPFAPRRRSGSYLGRFHSTRSRRFVY